MFYNWNTYKEEEKNDETDLLADTFVPEARVFKITTF